ncbi:hypothetical protein FRA_52c15770 [Francisella sp. W12-1067]|nr:hypothetical protein FRA_52c15770 [Francisella sp. W12-1067]
MKFKEYNLDNTLRICSYIVDNENLDFHRHQYLSDITYCVYGRLLLELPRLKESMVISPGQIIQVPKNEWHRVTSYNGEEAKYILIQEGQFNIEFNESLALKENMNMNHNVQPSSKYGDINANIKHLKDTFHKYLFFNCDDKKDIAEAINVLCNILKLNV